MEELIGCLGIVSVEEVVRHGRLIWHEHVDRKDTSDSVSVCKVLQVLREEVEKCGTSL